MNQTVHKTLIFFVNGKKIVEENPDPEWTLIYYLRNKLQLCGTKLGCGEGGCGACTVMISKFDHRSKQISHIPVNACLAPVCGMHGRAVTTTEGIGSVRTKLHPVQERLAKSHGAQCGFCTPGIVMSMYTLLRTMEKPSIKEIEDSLQGNLCRCTGYRPIIEAFATFSEEWELKQQLKPTNGCQMGDQCCKNKLYSAEEFAPYNPQQELIFPPELKLLSEELNSQVLHFAGPRADWHRPQDLAQLLHLKKHHPNSKLVVGNSEIGVEVKFKNLLYPVLISPIAVTELTQCSVEKDGIIFGASTTLQNLEAILSQQVATQPKHKTRIFAAIIDMLQYFAGKQIRSVASIGGNIITGSPISDLNPIFMACGAELVLQSSTARRTVKIDQNFYTAYRKNVLNADEILVSVYVPYTKQNQYFQAHKQSRRRDDDIAIVNSAINVEFEPSTNRIKSMKLAFGGLAPTTQLAINTSTRLIGMAWNEDMLETAYSALLSELPLSNDAPGGMIDYRRTLPLCFFFRTYLAIAQELNTNNNMKINDADLSGVHRLTNKVHRGSQFYETNQDYPVGRPVVHQSALKAATGEAAYLDDIPHLEHEIHLGFVYSKKAHANIVSVDYAPALALKGVVGYVCAEDVPENHTGLHSDEEVFATKTVHTEYQSIGAILAEDAAVAKRAANLVKIVYEELKPIITIEDAIKHGSLYEEIREIQIGDAESAMKNAKHVIEGECRTGYQEHFYLEPQACLVIPKEEDELEITTTAQGPTLVAEFVARALKINSHKIVSKVRRVGGAFGGKETKCLAMAVSAAIAAKKFNRPVRIVLDRDQDMAITGGRHPFLMKYKVGFEDDGSIIAYEAELYNSAGYSKDASILVMEHGMFHLTNAYNIPNVKAIGRVCRTNLPSNTAFRGFGAPQVMLAAEHMIRDVANTLDIDYTEIASKNLFKNGDVTITNNVLEHCNEQACLDQCVINSDYHQRKAEIEKYNKSNRWKKRGIELVCTKYGIGFNVSPMEQAGALLLVYKDGSVLLNYAGVEMGQGLHTKMIQIVSKVLNLPVEMIYIGESATDKVPNTTATAGSLSSDLNGMAVVDACNKLLARLKPIMDKNPKGSWKQWIETAYLERISLSASGFYVLPKIGYDFKDNKGRPFHYYTSGVACTEVEIDCLTGDHQVLRTDIVMDVGNSLNPAIDIGQIEGAFMQGYGLFVMEELVVSPAGTIFSKGPGAYKIPGFADIPIELNVELLKGSSNPRAIYSSKAIGEPPLFLASSAFFAIKSAIAAARRDEGIEGNFKLDAPASADKIRMACSDRFTKKVMKTSDKSVAGWSVTL